MQYESLIDKETMPGDLQGLKAFLDPGFDTHLPSDALPLTNWKHMRGGPDTVSRAGAGGAAAAGGCREEQGRCAACLPALHRQPPASRTTRPPHLRSSAATGT